MRFLRKSLLVLLAACTAFIAVGLTAPADGPFTIAIQPVLWRMDAAAIAESRAGVLGVDVDVKVGSVHLHIGWSGFPLSRQ